MSSRPTTLDSDAGAAQKASGLTFSVLTDLSAMDDIVFMARQSHRCGRTGDHHHNINVPQDVRHSLRAGRVAIGLFKGVYLVGSKARDAQAILFHVTSDVDLGRTRKFIERLGYRFIGGSYAKTIV